LPYATVSLPTTYDVPFSHSMPTIHALQSTDDYMSHRRYRWYGRPKMKASCQIEQWATEQ